MMCMYGLKSAFAGMFPHPVQEMSCKGDMFYKIPQQENKGKQGKHIKNYAPNLTEEIDYGNENNNKSPSEPDDISFFVTITENSNSTTVTIIQNDSMEMVRNVIKENLTHVKHNEKSDSYKSKDRTISVLWYKTDKLVVCGNKGDRSRWLRCLVSSLKQFENNQGPNQNEEIDGGNQNNSKSSSQQDDISSFVTITENSEEIDDENANSNKSLSQSEDVSSFVTITENSEEIDDENANINKSLSQSEDVSSFVTITENSTTTTVTIIQNDSTEIVRDIIKDNLTFVKHNIKSDSYKSKDRTVTVVWYKTDKLVVSRNKEDRSRWLTFLVRILKQLGSNPVSYSIPDNSEERESLERLHRHCSEHNLEIRGNPRKDGNCFFAAVSSQIERLNLQHHFKLDSIDPQYLRQRVTDFIRNNRTILETDVKIKDIVGDIDEHCDVMEKDGQWADHVVVDAMARMLRHDIKILQSTPSSDDIKDRFSLIKGSEQPSGDPLVIGHIFECHYVSLQIRGEFGDNHQEYQESEPTNYLNKMSSKAKTSKEQIEVKGNRKADFFIEDTPHGFIKRYIYKKYLQQFIAETQDAGLVSHVYDVFAGEGSRYSNNWSPVYSNEGSSTSIECYGSPVMALRVAIEYFVSVKQLSNVYNPCVVSVDNLEHTCYSELKHYSIRFCFVEKNKKHFKALVNNIKLTLVSYNIDINIKEVKKSKNTIMEVEISSRNEDFPIFVCIKNDEFENLNPPDLKEGECMSTFIDPYGYSQIPMERVQKFIGPRKSAFINFMSNFVHRFRKTMVVSPHVTGLFDLSKKLLDEQINGGKNLVEIYTERLKVKAETEFVLDFEVISKVNQVLYYLIFITNDLNNLKWMKKSFVFGSQFDDKLAFSDFLLQRRGHVMSLHEDQDDHKAASAIFEHFCSQAKVRVEEIEKFIWCKTIFVWRRTIVELIQKSRRLLKVEDSTGNSINCSEFPHGALLSFR
ncbi:Hypothetical predicted protein [Mytilus galloprovincialis]|uniref:OTU domain-containing protein n=1 Tax=Mytilus galloprovincialis TaxID=29158 RepID=A0A8B6D5L2_MYTGA|nr:Hypothetical predicted protein [Mytilus galloprovincialis]